MEKFILEKDVHLICIRAVSFPAGIAEAQEKLEHLFNPVNGHNYYGVSYLYDDDILYFAGVEIASESETIPLQCERYTLRKGTYISVVVTGYRNQLPRIKEIFDSLLDEPQIDPKGCCAEMYLPAAQSFRTATDIRCMVRLAD
jgi:hypothetical protein